MAGTRSGTPVMARSTCSVARPGRPGPLSISQKVQGIGLKIRGRLLTSEVELRHGELSGLGVHIAVRLMDLAEPGELIVSSVVRDLSVGSGLEFTDRGRHSLKGVPYDWQVCGAHDNGESRKPFQGVSRSAPRVVLWRVVKAALVSTTKSDTVRPHGVVVGHAFNRVAAGHVLLPGDHPDDKAFV